MLLDQLIEFIQHCCYFLDLEDVVKEEYQFCAISSYKRQDVYTGKRFWAHAKFIEAWYLNALLHHEETS
jgi:hypothetical protein